MRGDGRDEGRERKAGGGLSHLYMTLFLYNFAIHMVIPAITMEALCSGLNECSFTIYLTGLQQSVIGLGTLMMMPLMGNLSDLYGRKVLLTVPMALAIIPLAYNQTTRFFYVYYVFKTLTAMVCEGSVHCLSIAYAADNVPENRRASVFGIISGIGSCAFVCGNLSTRFLPTPSVFQVAASVGVLATVYMKLFLPESINVEETNALESKLLDEESPSSEDSSSRNKNFFRGAPSVEDTLSLLKISKVFSQVAFVAFLAFSLNADDSIQHCILGSLLCSYVLNFNSFLTSLSASLLVCLVLQLRSITSKQVGPNEQGKAQGCISGISSFANVMSPLDFSPLTALFLSKDSPFHFPGFSIMLTGFAVMATFAQSLMIRSIRTKLCADKCTNVVVA